MGPASWGLASQALRHKTPGNLFGSGIFGPAARFLIVVCPFPSRVLLMWCRIGRSVRPGVLLVAALLASTSTHSQSGGTLNGHPVRFGPDGKLLSWLTTQSTAYDQVLALNTGFLLNGVPNASNGLKLYYSYSYASPSTLQPSSGSPHNPAGLYAMLTDSGLAYAAYSGNTAIMNLVRDVLTLPARSRNDADRPGTGPGWPTRAAIPGRSPTRGRAPATATASATVSVSSSLTRSVKSASRF